MKNYHLRIFAATLILAAVAFDGSGQGGITLRVALNSGMFMSEPGSSDAVADPYALSNSKPGGADKFKSEIKIGVEAGVFVPIGNYFGIGFDVASSKYAGHNDNPVYYNYFASVYSPILNYAQQPLVYNTNITNLLGNIRIFPLGHGTVSPFIKLYGGVGIISTDLRFKSPEDQVEIADPLYSRGTRLSIVEPKKFNAAHFGIGPGFDYRISGNLFLNAELTFSYLNSDIVNGVPNFSYDELKGQSVYDEVPSVTSQFSVGVLYQIGGDKGYGNGRHVKSFGARKGKSYRRSPVFRR